MHWMEKQRKRQTLGVSHLFFSSGTDLNDQTSELDLELPVILTMENQPLIHALTGIDPDRWVEEKNEELLLI